MEERNKGSENLPTLAGVSIYRYNKTRDGLVQEMDSLESETLEPQGVLDLMASYGALPEATELISYEQDGRTARSIRYRRWKPRMTVPCITIPNISSSSKIFRAAKNIGMAA